MYPDTVKCLHHFNCMAGCSGSLSTLYFCPQSNGSLTFDGKSTDNSLLCSILEEAMAVCGDGGAVGTCVTSCMS